MEKLFSIEQLNALYPAEIHFENVIKNHNLRSAPRWLTEQIAKIYTETTGKKLPSNYSCNTCVYNIYAKIGELYFKSKLYWEQKISESKLSEDVKHDLCADTTPQQDIQQVTQSETCTASQQGTERKEQNNESKQAKRVKNKRS